MNRYKDIQINRDSSGNRYYSNTVFPEIPLDSEDIYVITSAGDRYDTLALQFYNNPSLWWIIAGVNNTKKDSLVVRAGIQLRIPANPFNVLKLYEEINSNR
jgi:hypothetical protein